MPITPFHLLAGISLKAATPKHFSWSVFALTNCLIDLEPILYFLITLNPAHRFFHTIIGATILAFLSATFGRVICEKLLVFWNDDLSAREARWIRVDPNISRFSAWTGALLGAWSHLYLDSYMHEDISPLSPFTDRNPLLGSVEIVNLHGLCVGLGLLGCALLFTKKYWLKASNKREL